jgi:archaeosine synthase
MDFEPLALHNIRQLLDELARTRFAAAGGIGHLRSLVESRAAADSWCNRVLRLADAIHHPYLEERTPVGGENVYPCSGDLALDRPAVRRFRDRLLDSGRYALPSNRPVLLLLPCSARKPYSTSPTHRRLGEAVGSAGRETRDRVHQVVVTSPLGLVPRELEAFFPAAHYDMPVAGRYGHAEREMMRSALSSLLDRGKYSRVICHLGVETPLLRDVLDASGLPVEYTAFPDESDEGDAKVSGEVDEGGAAGDDLEGDGMEGLEREDDGGLSGGAPAYLPPASDAALEALRRALSSLPPHEKGDAPTVHEARLAVEATLRFQFGEAGAGLVTGPDVAVRGPPHRRTLLDGKEQLGVLDSSRGMVSLTLSGARRLHSRWKELSGSRETPGYWVEIEDFVPEGNLFAAGVLDACPAIRPGDEVFVIHGDDVRAVGRAGMCGMDMVESGRGMAVDIRHRKK